MESLPTLIHQEFEEYGNWVVQKTMNGFSAIVFDHVHEQNNGVVRGSGGAVGLTENPSAFRKWMIAGPEQACLIKEFEQEYTRETVSTQCHHEEGACTQKSFQEQAKSLVQTINEMGNPFLDDTPELLKVDTRDVFDESVTATVRGIEALGKERYEEYCKSVIKNRTTSIHPYITQSRRTNCLSSVLQHQRLQAQKHDAELFSHLYIVLHHRQVDMSTVFSHENYPYPPSLSNRGKLRIAKKSDLLNILIDEVAEKPPIFLCQSI